MKKIMFTVLAASLLATTACTNLHEEILNEETGQSLVSDSSNLTSVIAPAYINVREIFFKNFELSTDELCIPARGTDWKSSNTQPLVLHDFKATNTNIRYIWRNTTSGIAACNTALLTLSELPKTDEVVQDMDEMIFIRAVLMRRSSTDKRLSSKSRRTCSPSSRPSRRRDRWSTAMPRRLLHRCSWRSSI